VTLAVVGLDGFGIMWRMRQTAINPHEMLPDRNAGRHG
jgi:hypothetical protein